MSWQHYWTTCEAKAKLALALPKFGCILMAWINAILQLQVALWAIQAVFSCQRLLMSYGCHVHQHGLEGLSGKFPPKLFRAVHGPLLPAGRFALSPGNACRRPASRLRF